MVGTVSRAARWIAWTALVRRLWMTRTPGRGLGRVAAPPRVRSVGGHAGARLARAVADARVASADEVSETATPRDRCPVPKTTGPGSDGAVRKETSSVRERAAPGDTSR